MDFTIQDKQGSSAVIRDMGGELKSFRTGGHEYIWQGDGIHWGESSPFLFPIASNVRQDTVYIEGKPYHLKQHGFARKLCWEAVKESENSVTLRLTDTPETLTAYPFRFAVDACYTLAGGVLTLEITVQNRDTRPMPYCLGTHPGFGVPFDGSESRFEDYSVVFEKEEENSCPLYDGAKGEINVENRASFLEPDNRTIRLDYGVIDRAGTIIFDKMNSSSVDLVDNRTGRKLTLGFEGFDYIAFWTDGGAFLCMEPWQGLSSCSDEDDSFLSKRGVQVLEPGEVKRHILRFSVR